MAEKNDDYVIDFISGQKLRATPEEVQAVQPFARILVDDYGYPKDVIQTRPQWRVKARPSDTKKEYPVDIAVFSDASHSDETLSIVVECKKKTRKDGMTQLQDYMRLSKASMDVWFNGNERLFLAKREHDGKVEFYEIPNIPRYGERLEDIGKFKRKDLRPAEESEA
ncbi:MAG: type I restriction enzyme HsdR N-terminal domain-containing protein [Adlercreutzia sp.]